MREVKYLSPTSVAKFYDNRTEFYLQYLADNRPPRLPQTEPMSMGSAFDAYVKAYMFDKIFGSTDPKFEFENIFEEQVEEQNRTWARINGKYVFECYQKSGALANLMIELQDAMEAPRFELKVEKRVTHESTVEGIPLLGKPDIFFVTKEGARVILDWKVNGYCSHANTSPRKGYVWVSDGYGIESGYSPSNRNRIPHKDAQVMRINGMDINVAEYLENIYEEWAAQLAMYAWILGEPVGGKFITGIDQIVANGGKSQHYIYVNTNGLDIDITVPLLRIAAHRGRISDDWQQTYFQKIRNCWGIIKSGHIFDDVSREESNQRCEILDTYYLAFQDSDDPNEQWFKTATGRG